MNTALLAFVTAALILGWGFAGLMALGFLGTARKWLAAPGNHLRAGLWLGATMLAVALWLVPDTWRLSQLAPEVTGLAFAVIVIDELNRRRADLQYKRDVVDQIGSDVNDAALEAVRIARKNGWLGDGSLKGAEMRGANLKGASLRGAHLEGAYLRDACLEGVDLSGAHLEDANLWDTNLKNADLFMANLNGAFLFQANLREANLVSASLANTDMSDANLSGANLKGAYPLGSSLKLEHYVSMKSKTKRLTSEMDSVVLMPGVTMDIGGTDIDTDSCSNAPRGANLENAILRHANLTSTDLRGANLRGTNLWGARLLGANLEDACLDGANLMFAKFDSRTIWPEDFDPVAAVAINTSHEISDQREPE